MSSRPDMHIRASFFTLHCDIFRLGIISSLFSDITYHHLWYSFSVFSFPHWLLDIILVSPWVMVFHTSLHGGLSHPLLSFTPWAVVQRCYFERLSCWWGFMLHSYVERVWSFGYRSDHLCHVTLDYVFHSMSLSCFLFRAFVFLFWLDTSFHFVITHLMLWGYVHDHLILALYTYHGPGTSLFVWSWIQCSTRRSYFNYRKVKGTFFTSTHFLRDSPWSPYYYFSYGARVEGWFKDICL